MKLEGSNEVKLVGNNCWFELSGGSTLKKSVFQCNAMVPGKRRNVLVFLSLQCIPASKPLFVVVHDDMSTAIN